MTLSLGRVARLRFGQGEPWLPAEFRALAAACEAEPADRTPFGALADWLDEHGEPEYAAAWRWLAARPEVAVTNQPLVEDLPNWRLSNLPSPLAAVTIEDGWVSHSLAAAVGVLAEQLAEVRRLVA